MRPNLGIYVRHGRDNQTARKAILVCFDDKILFDDYDGDIERSLKQRFRIKTLGDFDYFIGMKIDRSESGSLHISETVYIQKDLELFRMENSRPVATLMMKQTLPELHS